MKQIIGEFDLQQHSIKELKYVKHLKDYLISLYQSKKISAIVLGKNSLLNIAIIINRNTTN